MTLLSVLGSTKFTYNSRVRFISFQLVNSFSNYHLVFWHELRLTLTVRLTFKITINTLFILNNLQMIQSPY